MTAPRLLAIVLAPIAAVAIAGCSAGDEPGDKSDRHRRANERHVDLAAGRGARGILVGVLEGQRSQLERDGSQRLRDARMLRPERNLLPAGERGHRRTHALQPRHLPPGRPDHPQRQPGPRLSTATRTGEAARIPTRPTNTTRSTPTLSIRGSTPATGNPYHWARAASPFAVKLGSNVTNAWTSFLAGGSTDWSSHGALTDHFGAFTTTNPLRSTVVAGLTTGRKCRPSARPRRDLRRRLRKQWLARPGDDLGLRRPHLAGHRQAQRHLLRQRLHLRHPAGARS